MRSKKAKVLVSVLALAMIVGCLSPIKEASARQETITIADSFDNAMYVGAVDMDVWNSYGDGTSIKVKELAEPGHVQLCTGKNLTGETNVLMSKEWYWEIHTFSFDLWIPKGADWAVLDFVDIDVPEDYPGDYGEHGEPMIYGGIMLGPENDFNLALTEWKDWGFKDNKVEDEWVSVKFVVEDAMNAKVMLAPRGKKFDESKAQRVTLAGARSFYNSNIVFADYKFCGYKLDNFVLDTDTGKFKEDLEDGKNDLFEEITIYDSTETCFPIVEEGGSRKMMFKKAAAEDRLIANTKLQQDDEHLKANDSVMDVSFTVDFSENNSNQELAFVFGLMENDSLPFSDTWAYVMSKSGGRLSYFDIDGKEKVHFSKNFGTTLRGNKVRLNLTKNGTLTAYLDGKAMGSYKGVKTYAGCVGFAAKTAIKAPIYIDDFEVQNNLYKVITTKSFSDDFSENRLGTTGTSNSDFAWNAEAGSIQVGNEELVWDAVSDYTYFGPAYEYETYELTFKLTAIKATQKEEEWMDATYLSRWLGIDFGKSASNVKTYGTYGMLATHITTSDPKIDWEEASTFVYKEDEVSPMEGEVHTVVKPIPAKYFEDITYDGTNKMRDQISPKKAVCFKFVALNDRVELYLKRASDKEYTLYVTVENIDPKGYVALCCTGYSYWSIDDFKIKNTAEIYHEAPPVEIEEIVLPSLEERGVGVEDTHWAREQEINANRKGGFPTVAVAIIGGTVLAAGVVSIILLGRKKKKGAEA